MERVAEFLRLAAVVEQLVDSGLTWEDKYALVFCPEVSGALRRTNLLPDYYDPDADYEADVMAFRNAVHGKAEELNVAVERLTENGFSLVDA